MTPSARAGRAHRWPHPRLRGPIPPVWPLSLLCLAAFGVAKAQGTSTRISPSLTITQTFTDNRELTAVNPRADAVTQISPGISISSRSGAVQGYLNYVGTGVIYARDSESNNFQNSLAARGTAEFVERRLTVDAAASITQQAISAFGRQSVDPTLNDRNRSEVRAYSITPVLRGRLLGDVAYQGQLSYAASRSSASNVGDTASLAASFGLSGGYGALGWGLSADRTIAEQDVSAADRRTMYGALRASISYRLGYDLQVSARAGREANNVVTTRSTDTWGGSVTWLPGPRTQASFNFDHRFFGNSHSLALSHRFARSIWTYTDSRDLSTGGSVGASTISQFDLFFQLFASIEPNPALRELRVREFLRLNGLDPQAQVSSGFLSSGNSVQRRQSLSFAIQGVRNTLAASAFAGRTTGLGAALVGDLSQVQTVRQSGLTLSWSYRLTPSASLGVNGSLQRTAGSGSQPGNDLRTVSASWSSALGPHSAVSVSVRHAASDGDFNAYSESAITGTLSMRF